MSSRDLKNIRQPLNTFFQQNVEPFQKSSIILSGGADKPYYYSLGNQSTVPFVRLQGSGGTQKEFTWGETVEVGPGQNVQVESASYMPGDIQIQSGRDTQNRPARTSIPIKTLPDLESYSYIENYTPITPVFPCDCRGAVRAFLGCIIVVPPLNPDGPPLNMRVIGLNKQHSWPGAVNTGFSSIDPTGKKYFYGFQLSPSTTYSMIGLGYGSEYAPTDYPMTLADYVTWQIETTIQAAISSTFFYTLEYR